MDQISFGDAEYAAKKKTTRREVFLTEMDKVVPWDSLLKVIAPFYPVAGRGRRPATVPGAHDAAGPPDAELVRFERSVIAVWRRKPRPGLLVHSDQGAQFTGHDWQDFLKAHGLVSSMSRRGNCHDNAVAESFFQLLERERIKRKIYVTRQQAKSDVFNYIEMFYNTRRQHGHNDGLSPVEFEKRYSKRGF
jgi:putative transposase